MFKILYLFHVRHEYAVTMINLRQKKRAGSKPSDATQEQFWSTGSRYPACLFERK